MHNKRYSVMALNKPIKVQVYDGKRDCFVEADDAMELLNKLDALDSYAGVQVLLQSILDEAYPPNTIVCSDKEGADTGAQLTAAARKILELKSRALEQDVALAAATLFRRDDVQRIAELEAELKRIRNEPYVPDFVRTRIEKVLDN